MNYEPKTKNINVGRGGKLLQRRQVCGTVGGLLVVALVACRRVAVPLALGSSLVRSAKGKR